MQRPGGSIDGKDLAQKGLKGKGQGAAAKLNDVDKKYMGLEKDGKLKSTPFSVPWTNEATAKIGIKAPVAKATTSTSPVKKAGFPGLGKKAEPVQAVEEPPKKKGFFGLF